MSWPSLWSTQPTVPATFPTLPNAISTPTTQATTTSSTSAIGNVLGQLTPEQQYAIQQQNWQQWQIYQQQYAQWQAQYGEQYQRELQAKMMFQMPPPVPNVPPPPPPDPLTTAGSSVPPPPPPAPTSQAQAASQAPTATTTTPTPNQYGQQQFPFQEPQLSAISSASNNPSSQNQQQQQQQQQDLPQNLLPQQSNRPNQQPIFAHQQNQQNFSINDNNQNNSNWLRSNSNRPGRNNNNSNNNNNRNNRRTNRWNDDSNGNYSGNFNDSNAQNTNQNDNRGRNNRFQPQQNRFGNRNQMSRNTQLFDGRNNQEREQQQPNQSLSFDQKPQQQQQEQQEQPPTNASENQNEEKSQEEIAFDEQFERWEEQFKTWKMQNADHPDRKAYLEYEQKMEDCRQKLLAKREVMRKRRLESQPVQKENASNNDTAVATTSNRQNPPQTELPVEQKQDEPNLESTEQLPSNENNAREFLKSSYSFGSSSTDAAGIPGLDLVDSVTNDAQSTKPNLAGLSEILCDPNLQTILAAIQNQNPQNLINQVQKVAQAIQSQGLQGDESASQIKEVISSLIGSNNQNSFGAKENNFSATADNYSERNDQSFGGCSSGGFNKNRNDSFDPENERFFPRNDNFGGRNNKNFDGRSHNFRAQNFRFGEQNDIMNSSNEGCGNNFDDRANNFGGRNNSSFNGPNTSFEDRNNSFPNQSENFSSQNEAFGGRRDNTVAQTSQNQPPKTTVLSLMDMEISNPFLNETPEITMVDTDTESNVSGTNSQKRNNRKRNRSGNRNRDHSRDSSLCKRLENEPSEQFDEFNANVDPDNIAQQVDNRNDDDNFDPSPTNKREKTFDTNAKDRYLGNSNAKINEYSESFDFYQPAKIIDYQNRSQVSSNRFMMNEFDRPSINKFDRPPINNRPEDVFPMTKVIDYNHRPRTFVVQDFHPLLRIDYRHSPAVTAELQGRQRQLRPGYKREDTRPGGKPKPWHVKSQQNLDKDPEKNQNLQQEKQNPPEIKEHSTEQYQKNENANVEPKSIAPPDALVKQNQQEEIGEQSVLKQNIKDPVTQQSPKPQRQRALSQQINVKTAASGSGNLESVSDDELDDVVSEKVDKPLIQNKSMFPVSLDHQSTVVAPITLNQMNRDNSSVMKSAPKTSIKSTAPVPAVTKAMTSPFTLPHIYDDDSNIVDINELLLAPGRKIRPKKIVILMRGPPGSGKSYMAKLIKDKEAAMGGSVRILSIDDYFTTEVDEQIKLPSGKMAPSKKLVYEYEAEMEDNYMQYMIKSFKKTILDSLFDIVIVDCVNHTLRYYTEFYNFAKTYAFTPYTCEMSLNLDECLKNNIHNRAEADIRKCIKEWTKTPPHYMILDYSPLLENQKSEQSDGIGEKGDNASKMKEVTEVQILDLISDDENTDNIDDDDDGQEADLPNEFGFLKSKWDNDTSEQKMARLDGISKPIKHTTIEDYLQMDGWEPPPSSSDGKKRVRWADIEEKREQDKQRAIGFVVGQTNWNNLMGQPQRDRHGNTALTKIKYI